MSLTCHRCYDSFIRVKLEWKEMVTTVEADGSPENALRDYLRGRGQMDLPRLIAALTVGLHEEARSMMYNSHLNISENRANARNYLGRLVV